MPLLVNCRDVIPLNPEKHPVPKQALARRFAQWLLSSEGQAAIGAQYDRRWAVIPSFGHGSKVAAEWRWRTAFRVRRSAAGAGSL